LEINIWIFFYLALQKLGSGSGLQAEKNPFENVLTNAWNTPNFA
jgi:hypothetical protein